MQALVFAREGNGQAVWFDRPPPMNDFLGVVGDEGAAAVSAEKMLDREEAETRGIIDKIRVDKGIEITLPEIPREERLAYLTELKRRHLRRRGEYRLEKARGRAAARESGAVDAAL